MVESSRIYVSALRAARRFFGGCPDSFTASARDDLAQEAALEVWRRQPVLRNPTGLGSYVRTISRRLRSRALNAHNPVAPLRSTDDVAEACAIERVCVEGRWYDKRVVLAALETELAAIEPLNSQLVRGFYEGFSCRELALRYAMDESVVKVRLYRSRLRIGRGVLRQLRFTS